MVMIARRIMKLLDLFSSSWHLLSSQDDLMPFKSFFLVIIQFRSI